MKEELLNKISLTKNLKIEKIGKDYIILKTKSYKDLKYILEEEITYFEDLTPSLEEVFIKLVGSKND